MSRYASAPVGLPSLSARSPIESENLVTSIISGVDVGGEVGGGVGSGEGVGVAGAGVPVGVGGVAQAANRIRAMTRVDRNSLILI